jgi:hypothetical protein
MARSLLAARDDAMTLRLVNAWRATAQARSRPSRRGTTGDATIRA